MGTGAPPRQLQRTMPSRADGAARVGDPVRAIWPSPA